MENSNTSTSSKEGESTTDLSGTQMKSGPSLGDALEREPQQKHQGGFSDEV